MSYKGLFLAAALALLSACDSSTPETPAAPSGKPAAQQEAPRPALDKAELAKRYRDDDLRVMASGTTQRHEEPYLKGGEARWLSTTKFPLRDKAGVIVGSASSSKTLPS